MEQEHISQYEKLKKKHQLPDLNSIIVEFEVVDIDSPFILRSIIKKIVERLQSYTQLVESILNPDTGSLSSVQEYGFFSDKDRKELFMLYKEFLGLERDAHRIVLFNDEKAEAEFINEAYRKWLHIKKQLISVLSVLSDSWKKDLNLKTELGYLG